MRPIPLAVALFGALATAAGADEMSPATGHEAMPATSAEAAAGFAAAMQKMHEATMQPPTGNVDVDFVRGMIAHHQGAIDMARIELAHGSDPEIREMAEEIIAAQGNEIETMQAWLAAHGEK